MRSSAGGDHRAAAGRGLALLGYTPTNALLATFAIFIGLLLWFRIIGIIMLVAAAWIAVAANDQEVPLLPQTEAERLADEHAALLVAAQVRLRRRRRRWRTPRGTARGRRSGGARKAEEELREVEAADPAEPRRGIGSLSAGECRRGR